MDLLELLQQRRSGREYTGEHIPEDQLDRILQAGLLSPSSRGRKPWEFWVVQKKEVLSELAHCRQGAAKMLERAGCAILVFADPEKTDVWIEDCAIAMNNMHLMATSLGLGSCWIQGRLREAENGQTTEAMCKKLLAVPQNYVLEAILSIGVLQKPLPPHTLAEIDWKHVHRETYSKPL